MTVPYASYYIEESCIDFYCYFIITSWRFVHMTMKYLLLVVYRLICMNI